MKIKTNLQAVIEAIESIVNDDFCESFSFDRYRNRLTEREKTAQEKISAVYMLAHAFNKSHICYNVHEDWRKIPQTKP